MRTFRKLLACVLTGALALCIAGTVRAETTRVVFWHCMSEKNGDAVQALVRAFNDGPGREAGITVDAVYQGSYTDATTKMKAILSANILGDLPDVMTLDATGKLAYAAAPSAYTADAAAGEDAAINLDALLPAARANWNLSGTLLGVPFAASTTVLYCNQTMLSQAQALPPYTFEDIAALAGRMTDADGQPAAVLAALPNTPLLANWLAQMGSDLVNMRNGADGTATALDCYDNGALEEFLTLWKALYASGALENRNGSSDEFVAGKTALYIASSSSLGSLLQKIGDRFELGVAPFPLARKDAEPGASVSGSCLVMFDRQEDARLAAARAFVAYMTSAPAQAAFAAQTGYVPVLEAALSDPEYLALLARQPQFGVAAQQFAAMSDDFISVTVGPSVDFYYAISNAVSDMLEYDLAPADTAEAMRQELEALLEQYARANP